jgi:hypothetical protein
MTTPRLIFLIHHQVHLLLIQVHPRGGPLPLRQLPNRPRHPRSHYRGPPTKHIQTLMKMATNSLSLTKPKAGESK